MDPFVFVLHRRSWQRVVETLQVRQRSACTRTLQQQEHVHQRQQHHRTVSLYAQVSTYKLLLQSMSSPGLACATAHSRIQTRNCSVLLAHAAAVSIFRAKYQRAGAVIGFTADSGWCDPDSLFVADGSCRIQTNCCRSEPWSTNASDVAAAERALLFSFAIFMDPLIFGDWPEEVRRRAGCCAATAAVFVLPKPLCYHCPSS